MSSMGSIYQRKSDGRWVGKYYVTEPLTGKTKPKYVYSSIPPKKKWKKDSSGTPKPPPHQKGQQEVRRKLFALIEKVKSGDMSDTSKMTVAGWLEKYLEVYCANLAITTREGYVRYIKNHINPVLGKIKLCDLRPLHIQHFYNLERGKEYSEKTILQEHRILNRAFKKAKGDGLIRNNPCESVDAPTPEDKEPEVYTEDEFTLLMDKLKGHRLEPIVLIAGMCGLRRGELMGLTWEDIDFEKGIINVERNAVPTTQGTITKKPKTDKSKRKFTVSSGVLERLKQIRGIGKIYLKLDGTEYHPSSVSREFKVFLKDNGLKHTKLHDLRHFNATMMLKYGVSEKEAQERLGHSNLNMTKKYQHVLKDMDKHSAEKLNSVLEKK